MKEILVFLGVGVLLARTANKVVALEAKVETLKKRNSDLALKARIVSSQLFESPLDNFFNSKEFWENTYDSGQADCANRCIQALNNQRRTCEAITDDTERQKCYQDAVDRASRCQQACPGISPM